MTGPAGTGRPLWPLATAAALAVMLAACAGANDRPEVVAAANDTDADVRIVDRPDSDSGSDHDDSLGQHGRTVPANDGADEIPSTRRALNLRPPGDVPRTVVATTGSSTSAPTTSPSTTSPVAGSQSTVVSGSKSTVTSRAAPQSVSPVTTVSGASPGVASLYTGVLGTLDRNQRVVEPLGPPPVVEPGVQPLTGLPGAVFDRPAAIVKIDNSPTARPQSGLNAADIVIEEEVEGGVTRFAAVFHSTSAIAGPVRSTRTTDIGLINSFGSPLLMYSGANEVTEALIRAQPTVQNRNAGTSSGYWRSSSRRAPSNLYTNTADHWASATAGPPPPQFDYRPVGRGISADHATAVPADSFSVAYRASTAGWKWNGSAWLRSQGTSAHLTDAGQQISAANVVVIEAREVPTGMVDSTGANVPEFVFVGAGAVTVFTDGKRIEGQWNRPSMAVAPTLMSGGSVIELTPGRTWIELIGQGKGLLR